MATTGALVLAGSVMLSWVAIFNHAPLVFADSLGYATAPLRGEVPGFFSIFYSVLILPFHQGVTLWPVVFVQGAILAHLLCLTTRCVSDGRITKPDILLIIAGLCVFSSLPWITGQILPDVLSPVLLLGMFLVAFCRDQLRQGELLYVCALMAVGIAAHFSHVPIAFGLILLCMGMKPIFAPNQIGIWHWATLLLMPFIVAVCSMLAVTWVDSRGIGFARNSNVFLLAKWVDEGPALSYLTRACPTARYALCAHVEELKGLTHDDLKWGWNSPFKKVGTFDELEPEARRIVRATLLAHPFEILQRAAVDAGRQFFRFQAGDGLSQDFARLVAGHLAPVFGPGIEKSLIESKQGQGRLPIAEARQFHTAGLIFAAGICFWSMKARRRALPRKLVTLCVFVVLGIIWNAIVTGALSGPYDRYLARVIWLVCFAAFIAFFYVARVREPGGPGNSPNHPIGPDCHLSPLNRKGTNENKALARQTFPTAIRAKAFLALATLADVLRRLCRRLRMLLSVPMKRGA